LEIFVCFGEMPTTEKASICRKWRRMRGLYGGHSREQVKSLIENWRNEREREREQYLQDAMTGGGDNFALLLCWATPQQEH
jgi:hypothetical protein